MGEPDGATSGSFFVGIILILLDLTNIEIESIPREGI